MYFLSNFRIVISKFNVLVAINDGISGAKVDINKRERILYFMAGVFFGALLLYFSYLNFVVWTAEK